MLELRHFAAISVGLFLSIPLREAKSTPAAKVPTPCVVSGRTVLPPGTTLFTQPTGTTAVATLPGAEVGLRIRFPDDAAALPARLAVETFRKGGYLRIKGWVERSKVNFFAKENIPLKQKTISLTQGMRIRPEATSAGLVHFRHTVVATTQTLSTKVACSALSLRPTVATVVIPSKARSYQMRKASIELLAGPSTPVVHRLELVGDSRKVFWSDESKGGYIHLHSHGDVTIDAWVKRNSVVRLRDSELFDMRAITPRLLPPQVLNIKDAPPVAVAKKNLEVFTEAGGKGKKIGTLESGSKYYPMEEAHDWVNIYPADLAVFPTTGFWIKPPG